MARILITGGSGFIGTNLVEHYHKKGDNVVNFDIASPRNKEHIKFWQKVDLLDLSGLSAAMEGFNPDYIIHMAARTDLNETENLEGYAANMVGVENFIKVSSKATALKRIIFASSRLVCKIGYVPKDEFDYKATTLYGKSKIITEKIIREAKDIPCSWVIVRPTSIWGPWFDIPYKTFFKTIKKGYYFHPGKHNPLKQMGYVGNTVYELDKLLFAPKALIQGKTIYLADYPPLRLKDWAETIREYMGRKKIRKVPMFILRSGGVCGDILKLLGWLNPPVTSFRVNNLITEMRYDMSPLKNITGDLPYSLVDGCSKTVNWLREHGEI